MQLLSKINPRQALILATTLSAAWLLVLYPLLNAWPGSILPARMRANTSDFGQYYTGALVARLGLWPHLYPAANRGLYAVPPVFQPKLHSPFFDYDHPASRLGKWAFYPQLATPEGSAVAPELLRAAPELQNGWHYILPPPVALILLPLAFLSLQTASHCWFWLMCAALCASGVLAARIFRLLIGRETLVEALLVLLPFLPTVLGSTMSTSLNVGNVSPWLGFLIALAAWSWMRNRQILLGVGLILLLLFKGMGVFWCVLLLCRPIKWKTLGTLAVLTLLLNGLALRLGGVQIYRAFLAVLPQVAIPLGTGLQGQLMSLLGVELKGVFLLGSLLLLALVGYGYLRRSTVASDRNPAIAAAMAGTMAAFCLLNSIVWPHYYSNYLLFPFAGWMVWEGLEATGIWQRIIGVMLALNLVFFLDGLFLLRDSWLIGWLHDTGHLSHGVAAARSGLNFFVVNIAALLESLFILTLAIRRLYWTPAARSGRALV